MVHIWLTKAMFDDAYRATSGHSQSAAFEMVLYQEWWKLATTAFEKNAFWWDASEPWSRRQMAVHVEVRVCFAPPAHVVHEAHMRSMRREYIDDVFNRNHPLPGSSRS